MALTTLLNTVLAVHVTRLLRPEHVAPVRLMAFDFDGVFTDNRVWVSETGQETVACNRSDGLGLEMARDAGVELVVLSKERNPVVQKRCEKLKLPVVQSLDDKLTVLMRMARNSDLQPEQIVYVGNDSNDVPCLEWVGVSIAVADAHPSAMRAARFRTRKAGGHGAVREVCDAWMTANDS